MEEHIKRVSNGVDTLILNVRYCDNKGQPIKQELDERLQAELEYLQGEARRVETAVATDWAFQDVCCLSSHMGPANNGGGCSRLACSRKNGNV